MSQALSDAELVDAIKAIEDSVREPTVALRCGRPTTATATGRCNRVLDGHLVAYNVNDGPDWWSVVGGSTNREGQPQHTFRGRRRIVRPSILRTTTAKAAGERGLLHGPRGMAADRVSYVCKCGAKYDWRMETLASAWVRAIRADQREIITTDV